MTPDELKKWRTDNGYTQGELSDILGIASLSVSRWEWGMSRIPPFLYLALKAIPKKGGAKKQSRTTKTKKKGG
jgi:DNA-binding transcriptional regulator YiaG